MRAAWCLPLLALTALAAGDVAARSPAAAPADLAATGLYSDAATKTVDPRHMAYAPQYPLWSDGAAKRRWISLPPGKPIDAADPDVWTFPVGAKLWKEFSFHGRPVETRYMEALGRGRWRFATYVWNAEGTAATRAPDNGLKGVVEIAPGIRHDIPSVIDCRACHEGRQAEALGFSALQLSPDRDSLAPHAEPVPPGGVDLTTLLQRRLLKHAPRAWAERPPRIDAPSPAARAALGYLHANCGNCHSPAGPLDSRGLLLRHSVAPGAKGEPAIDTTKDRPGRYRIPGLPPERTRLLSPGDPAGSSVAHRMAARDAITQMPPLGTKIADAEAVDLVRRWIREMAVRPHIEAGETEDRKPNTQKEEKQ
ncbi:MAG: hypothetical protein C4523_02285 [Myxococcales bacterium]|nr:MAG: hypothetical protein C4523_02285 [Myxococcales bacterium]